MSQAHDDSRLDRLTQIRIWELCRLCKVHRATVHRWIKSGKIPPPTKLAGTIVVWNLAVIERWLAGHGGAAQAESSDSLR